MSMTDPSQGQRSHLLGNVLQPLRQVGQRIANLFAPASEASSTKDAYRVEVELPGVTSDEVDVEVVGGDTLVVRGEKRDQREERGEGYIFSERSYGRFERAFNLPADADVDGIEADYANGVLSIQIPRKAEQQRQIKVRRG